MISMLYALTALAPPAAEPSTAQRPCDSIWRPWKAMPRVTVTVMESEDKVTYSGVPFRTILDTKGARRRCRRPGAWSTRSS